MKIFENDFLFIERENAQIPWLKIFTKEPFVELTDCPSSLQNELWRVVAVCVVFAVFTVLAVAAVFLAGRLFCASDAVESMASAMNV